MASTLAQKLIARACGRTEVQPGEIVTCKVDLAMIHDSSGPRRVAPILDGLGAELWDRDRILLVSDHYTPAVDGRSAAILDLTRKWAEKQGIRHFYDMRGICHIVIAEGGHLLPGRFIVGGDSHSTTGGAFACFMFGIGATEMAGVLATGEIWLKVPETIRINCRGEWPASLCAKDAMLVLCARLGMNGARYQAVEYTGEAVARLAMFERMTLSNMAAELGAQAGLIGADETTRDYLCERGTGELDEAALLCWRSDADARYLETHDLDVSAIAPQVATPHSPANAADVAETAGTAVQQAYIGACTGAKLSDLHMAAQILKGRTVAPSVRLLIAPASTEVSRRAAADGTFTTLSEAGAILVSTGCGACAGLGAGLLAEDEACISSSARNFRGRMGAPSSRVYLASPYTVAATAVAGVITDPRPMLAERSHDR